MPHHLVAAPPHTPGMWAAHTVAALLTLLAWRRGEQALRALAGLATGALATVLLLIARGVEPPPAIVLPAGLRRAVRARPQRYPPAAPRRGPPVVAA